jgi:hypothetical protein
VPDIFFQEYGIVFRKIARLRLEHQKNLWLTMSKPPLAALQLQEKDSVNAVSHYENGKTKPPLALVKLFKLRAT